MRHLTNLLKSLALATFLSFPLSAKALDIYVDNRVEGTKPEDGSPEYPFHKIGKAINLSPLTSNTIHVLGPGPYFEKDIRISIDTHKANLEIKAEDGECVIDAEGKGRIFYINAQDYRMERLIFKGFTFRNGKVSDNEGGGLVLVDWLAHPEFSNCTFKNGTSDYTTITLSNGGGAVRLDLDGGATFSHCSFLTNSALQGAIYATDSPAFFDSCTFTSNTASVGGAVAIGVFSETKIQNSFFENNSATISGGAIQSEGNSSPQIDFCTFRNNNSPSGAITFTGGFSYPSITNCVVADKDKSRPQVCTTKNPRNPPIYWAYSCITGPQGNVSSTSPETLIFTDPRFSKNFGYELRGDSPCIGLANPNSDVEYDIDGKVRKHRTAGCSDTEPDSGVGDWEIYE